jgi:hypothetical protein
LPEGASFAAGLAGDQRWGRWTTTETVGEWSPDNIVEWRGVVSLPGGLPAGDYRLRAGLQGSANAVPLAEFAISEKDPAIRIE